VSAAEKKRFLVRVKELGFDVDALGIFVDHEEKGE
jgi:hypothetical protein